MIKFKTLDEEVVFLDDSFFYKIKLGKTLDGNFYIEAGIKMPVTTVGRLTGEEYDSDEKGRKKGMKGMATQTGPTTLKYEISIKEFNRVENLLNRIYRIV